MATYTTSKMLVSKECFDEIKDYINDLGPDYQRMFTRDGSIDMTHIALAIGPRPKFMPPRQMQLPLPSTTQADYQTDPKWAAKLEANKS